MIEDIRKMLAQYHEWLKDKTSLQQVGEWAEITTPHLAAKLEGSNVLLSDDGYTISDLRSSGCDLETKKRKDLLQMTLRGFGVRLEGDTLCVTANPSNFPIRKHNLVQAMLAVNDLFYLAAPLVQSLFLEDVTVWLDLHDIRYIPKAKFAGKSGYDYLFDFAIPASKKSPERIVQAINRPTIDTAKAFLFAWLDTRENRPQDSQAYAILNDGEAEPSASVLEAFQNYDVNAVVWSRRDEIRPKLAA